MCHHASRRWVDTLCMPVKQQMLKLHVAMLLCCAPSHQDCELAVSVRCLIMALWSAARNAQTDRQTDRRAGYQQATTNCIAANLACQHCKRSQLKGNVRSAPLDAGPGVFKVPQHAGPEEDACPAHLVHAALHPKLLQQRLARLQCPSLCLACPTPQLAQFCKPRASDKRLMPNTLARKPQANLPCSLFLPLNILLC